MPGEMKNVSAAGPVAREAEFYLELAVETGKITLRALKSLSRGVQGRPPKPAPTQEFPKRFHKRVTAVWGALWACGKYQPGTIVLYTHVIGKLLEWAEALSVTELDWRRVEEFLQYYAAQRRRHSTEHTVSRSEDGLAIRYIAFYAIRAVFDQLCGLSLTEGMRPPPHPSPVDAVSAAACRTLFGEINCDREQLLLLLTNGVGLRPSETAALGWHDFAPAFGDVTVQRRDRTLVLEIPRHVAALLDQCRQRCPAATYVFQSRRGTAPAPLGVRSLQYVLSRLVDRCGLDERITLTSLRKAADCVPGGTPGRRPSRDRRDEGGGEGVLQEVAPAPWESVQDSAAARDTALLADVSPECAALRRQILSCPCGRELPRQAADDAAGQPAREAECDLHAECSAESASNLNVPVKPVSAAQLAKTTVRRPQRAAPVLLFPVAAPAA